MKNILKTLFIIFVFLVSLSIFGNSENSFVSQNFYNLNNKIEFSQTQQQSEPELIINVNENENSLVASNFQNNEIFASNDSGKSHYGTISTDKATNQNKSTKQNLSKKYNNFTHLISHKISPYLRSEICTRAP